MTSPVAVEAPESEASAPTLGDEISEMLGDFIPSTNSSEGESPDSGSASAGGTTPLEPAPETRGQPTDAGTVPSDAGEATALGTTPGAAAAAQDDPFKDTTPLTFNVNGRAVSDENIRVFKEGGAVIRPEHVQAIQQKLSERESLQERNHRQSQEYQTLSKVTEWSGQDGKILSGIEGAIENRVANAVLFAENKLLIDTLSNPDTLFQLLTTRKVTDQAGNVREQIILNPVALKNLQRENQLQQREIRGAILDHYKGLVAQANQPQAAPLDYSTEAPRLAAEVAKAANLDASVLTPEDKALLAEHIPAHIGKDAQGNPVVSVAWQNLVKRMISDRTAQRANAQKLVTTTADATKTGLANMAAAARGVRQPVRPAVPQQPVRRPTKAEQKAKSDGDMFDMMRRAGANALRQQK